MSSKVTKLMPAGIVTSITVEQRAVRHRHGMMEALKLVAHCQQKIIEDGFNVSYNISANGEISLTLSMNF